ncbi:MAG: hypothetical protein KKF98_14690, partial [Bacteroidetes bacterium]|nr:hypothetical protein [Bacteroidota bacterium]
WIEIQGYNVGRAYGTLKWYQGTPEVFEGWLLALAETECTPFKNNDFLSQTRRVFSTRRVEEKVKTSISTRRVLPNPVGQVFSVFSRKRLVVYPSKVNDKRKTFDLS